MFIGGFRVLCPMVGAFLVAGYLVGCSSEPVTAQEAKPISSDRQFAYSDSDEATLVVTRDKGGYEGKSTIHVDFLIDGKPAASIRPREVVKFGLKAGTHILGVSIKGSPVVEREVSLKAGEVTRRRITYYNSLDITPTAFK
ncbi:hypothetical protein [Pseudomonas protegens]|uniref:hypothetical protein n=1 Tax=Pseudomonas protegens TaxID=380021 RepID=UPI001C69D3C3|nr:hypothetical protein [Pseudomonas protegens]QYN03713.1 hypothetical protein K1T36_11395 [Pseudomonas protegens]